MALDLLTADEIENELAELDDWEWVDDGLRRDLDFDSFMEAIDFINRIAPWAEEMDHHPEIRNVYTNVALVLTTHDAGGVTRKDIELAARIDAEV